VLIPVTASNIPELLLADPRFEQSTRNVVFWHKKFSRILWLFQLLQINCSSAVSSLSNGISSKENTPHWKPLGRIYIHITEVIPLTLGPYQEFPWTEPHYICLQLLFLSLHHTSLCSPLIIQSSFHIHADSEDLQYGLGRG
jgi:hypothetical protein